MQEEKLVLYVLKKNMRKKQFSKINELNIIEKMSITTIIHTCKKIYVPNVTPCRI